MLRLLGFTRWKGEKRKEKTQKTPPTQQKPPPPKKKKITLHYQLQQH